MQNSEGLPVFYWGIEQNIPIYKWALDHFHSYIKPRTIILGDYLPAFADLLARDEQSFHLAPKNKCELADLQCRYHDNPKIHSEREVNLKTEIFSQVYSSMEGMFGTVISQHVISDELDNTTALRNEGFLLRPRGHLLLILPSFTSAFPNADLDLQTWKLLDWEPIKKRFQNFEILKIRHFLLAESNTRFNGSHYNTYIALAARKLY